MRTTLAAAVLGSLVLLVSPTPAFAHADLVKSSPRNGSTVATSPAAIVLTFGEDITPQSIPPAVTDRASRAQKDTVPIDISWSGPTLTLKPRRPLSTGTVEASYRIVSSDGHPVEGSITFVVGSAGPRGPAQMIVTKPAVPVVVSGSRPGPLTLTIGKSVTSGEVSWYGGGSTITWPVAAAGKKARASGVLPTSGTWHMIATLQTTQGTVLVIKGDVDLR